VVRFITDAQAVIDMTLRDIKQGSSTKIVRVKGNGPFRQRLMEMGFRPGEMVFVERYAPLKDPVEFVIKQYHVSLRRKDAAMIEVTDTTPGTQNPSPDDMPRAKKKRHRWLGR
jgi:ferrous iron transport protein A